MSFENETNMNNIEDLTDINEETSSETAVSEEVSEEDLGSNDKEEVVVDRKAYQTNIPESLRFLVNGYLDYAKEVVLDRAIPSIDGFKPSQRRIMYAMKFLERDNDLTKDFTKCGGIAGTTMKIHPHGDASIYDTMVRMTDEAMYLNTPFIKGKGSFGHVFSTDEKPAAARYTECMFTKIAEECFKGMDGIEMIPSYDNKLKEPLLLPVSFPSIL